MPDRRIAALVVPAIIALLTVVILVVSNPILPFNGGIPEVGAEKGKLAPDFEVTDLKGRTIKLSDFRGKVIVIEFFATWCPVCREQSRVMEQLYSKYASRGVVLMTIDVGSSTESLVRFVKERGIRWIVAKGEEIGVKYGVYAIPTTFIVDQRGVIRFKAVGTVGYHQLASMLEELLTK